MNILFDVSHPAHINFFKNAIIYLNNKKEHDVFVTCLRRGKLPEIAKKELVNIDITFVGKHRGTAWSIIFEANIVKFFELLRFIKRRKIKVGVSAGNVPLSAALKVFSKKSILFDDDPERSKKVFLEKMTASLILVPPIFETSSKIKSFNALKEWSYLSPKYFNPCMSSLTDLDIRAKEYIFIREVSTNTFNYKNQDSGIILNISSQIPKTKKVVLSLEDKKSSKLYPSDWIILEEPVKDIHSLIYFSCALLSSGDSMAREGAQLGVPSIYCGLRDMKANKILVERGMLFEIEPLLVSDFLLNLYNNKFELMKQNNFREKLNKEWEDLNELIINSIFKIVG